MSTMDGVIVVLLLVAGIRGYMAGFMRSTLGMAAVATGVLVAGRCWPLLLPYVEKFIERQAFAKWASVVIVAAVTTVAADWLLVRLRGVFERGALGTLNHVAGAGFNVLFVALILGLLLLVVTDYGDEELFSFLQGSHLAPRLVTLARHVLGLAKPILPSGEPTNWVAVRSTLASAWGPS